VEQLEQATEQLVVDTGFFRGRSVFVDLDDLGVALRSIAARSFTPGRSIVEAAQALCTDIHATFKFDAGFSDVSTPLHRVLAARRGVCQDFAHLAIGCLRSLSLPARYVSGYLRTTPPPGKPRLVGADASHAWTSAWCGPLGWIDFDPTNNQFVSDAHVTIAWGRDYGDICPIQGVFVGGGDHGMGVSVDVAPQDETQRGEAGRETVVMTAATQSQMQSQSQSG